MTDAPVLNPALRHTRYLVRRKILKLFGAAFHVYDPEGQVVFYSSLKAFKLKEEIRLESGEDMQQEVMTIQARHVMDIAATYEVTDSLSGLKVGALKRKGLKSIFKDEWIFMDADDQPIGLIKEDNALLAFIRRTLINLIPQTYQLEMNDRQVGFFKQTFNPFGMKLVVDLSADTEGLLDRRLALAGAILLCAIEGRQN